MWPADRIFETTAFLCGKEVSDRDREKKTTKIENKHKGGEKYQMTVEKNVTPKAQHVNLIVSLDKL